MRSCLRLNAETDTSDLPSGLAKRMSEWRDETVGRTLRVILEGYGGKRDGAE